MNGDNYFPGFASKGLIILQEPLDLPDSANKPHLRIIARHLLLMRILKRGST
jgi:hypothetical protein